MRQPVTLRLLRLLFMAFACVAVSGCSALQDVRYLDYLAEPGMVPTVVGAQGALSKKSSKALLASRWKNSYLDTKALAAVEELATGRPLIAGNKVTLLYDGPQTMA